LWGNSKLTYRFKAISPQEAKEWVSLLRTGKVNFMNQRCLGYAPQFVNSMIQKEKRLPKQSSAVKNTEPNKAIDFNPSFNPAYYKDDKPNINIVIDNNNQRTKIKGGTAEKIVEKLLDEVIAGYYF